MGPGTQREPCGRKARMNQRAGTTPPGTATSVRSIARSVLTTGAGMLGRGDASGQALSSKQPSPTQTTPPRRAEVAFIFDLAR